MKTFHVFHRILSLLALINLISFIIGNMKFKNVSPSCAISSVDRVC